ncbi:MAG: hypothetical protein PHX78_03530 [bacterium]|nr:hypothetical protein [bacterium]
MKNILRNLKKIIKNIFKIFSGLILILFLVSNANAQLIGYTFNDNGKIYEIDFGSCKILREMNVGRSMDAAKIIYDKNNIKSYIVFNSYEIIIVNLIDFKIEKTIKSPDLYKFSRATPIFLNLIKNQIYIETKKIIDVNKKQEEHRLLSYNTNDYSYSEVDNKFFRYYQFTSDGKYLYRIWDNSDIKKIEKRSTSNFELINTFHLPEIPKIDDIESFILSPDNKKIYINGFLRQDSYKCYEFVLDATNGNLLNFLTFEEHVAAISEEAKYLYTTKIDTATSNFVLKKINTDNFSQEEIPIVSDHITVDNISISPDGSVLLIGSDSDVKNPKGYVTVVDLKERKIKGQIELETFPIAIYFE